MSTAKSNKKKILIEATSKNLYTNAARLVTLTQAKIQNVLLRSILMIHTNILL